jgi:DNA-damage-inducible protein D
MLAEAARDAGVIGNEEFAAFQNAGYMGLCGGMTVDEIHESKGLTARQKILDFIGSEELIASLFRISQTESKLKRENIQGVQKASDAHYAVGREVRSAIERVGGAMPEDLPAPDKSISQVEREQLNKLKNRKKPLMLDE